MDVDAVTTKGKPGGKKGKDGKAVKFDGECKFCGKYGHMEKECWKKLGKGKGDKGKDKKGGKLFDKGKKGNKLDKGQKRGKVAGVDPDKAAGGATSTRTDKSVGAIMYDERDGDDEDAWVLSAILTSAEEPPILPSSRTE